jgi:hypothetical protein
MREGEMVFVLAQHYLRNENYRNYVKQLKAEGMWTILDNGVGDHDFISQEQLIEAAKDLMPSEIIPLDVLFGAEATLGNLDDFIELMKANDLFGKIEIFAVPQGATKEDWLYCYKKMLWNENVTTIGFSKIAIPYAWNTGKDDQGIMEGRHQAYEELMSQELISKPIHCLGAGDPREFLKYKENPLMRSTDSCFSVWAGMCGISWTEGNFRRIKTPKNYFEQNLSFANCELAIQNIQFLREMTKSSNNG